MACYRTSCRGGFNPDSVPFDDLETARGDSEQPLRLRALTVWEIQGAVSGIQALYEDGDVIIEGNLHRGVHDIDRQTVHTLFLDDDEYLTDISIQTGGMHNSILNYLELKTSKGRLYTFGDPYAPTKFKIDVPSGHCIVAFYGGMGGHMHNIGAFTRSWVDSRVYLYVAKKGMKCERSVFGTATSTTLFGEKLADASQRVGSIAKISMSYNKSSLCAMDVSYRLFGRLTTFTAGSNESGQQQQALSLFPGEDIIGISGRFGNFINALYIQTTTRLLKTGTSSGFKATLDLPEGHIVTGLSPGYNGYVQCIAVYHSAKPPVLEPSSPHGIFETKSQVIGKVRSCSVECDDTPQFVEVSGVRLLALTIYHCANHVYGFGNTFIVGGKPVKCKHYFGPGYSQGAGHQRSKVKLSPGEFIVTLNVKQQDGIEGLQILTTFQQVLNFGNTSAPLESIRVPAGHAISALCGGIADPSAAAEDTAGYGNLHYMSAYYGLLRLYDNFLPIYGSLEPAVQYQQTDSIGEIDQCEAFSDTDILAGQQSARLAVICFRWEAGRLAAVKCRYLVRGCLYQPEQDPMENCFCGAASTIETLILSPNEFVITISVQVVERKITYLRLTTTKRRKGVELGVFQMSTQIQEIPVKGCVVGFAGEPSGSSTTLFAITRAIPEVVSSF